MKVQTERRHFHSLGPVKRQEEAKLLVTEDQIPVVIQEIGEPVKNTYAPI